MYPSTLLYQITSPFTEITQLKKMPKTTTEVTCSTVSLTMSSNVLLADFLRLEICEIFLWRFKELGENHLVEKA